MSNFKKEIIEWIKTIVISFILAMIITTFIRPTLVKGYSMYPTLEENDYLLINRMAYRSDEPQRGDIVVFKSHIPGDDGKEKDLVKRVIGISGDKIEIVNGIVYVNNEELIEDYINGDYTEGYVNVVVPDGYVFVLGDNRPNSMDSRHDSVGFVSMDEVVGKVFIRLYPFNKIQLIK
ncbi:signal peptidase I [Alkalithermobacter thermoalcaliphilus]